MIDQWIIDAELPANYYGKRYRVHSIEDSSLRKIMVCFQGERTKTEKFHTQFRAEMAILRRLNHPRIVRYFDHGIYQNNPYFLTDDIHGSSGFEPWRQGYLISWELWLSIALEILDTLRYAHRRKIFHRALHPGNLIQRIDGSLALAEFGLAKLIMEHSGTESIPLPIPVEYAVPEMILGKPYTKRSDLYALGTLLYGLLVGRPPFVGQTSAEVIQKVCFALPERPIHLIPKLPEAIDQFINRLLTKDPQHRPGSCGFLIEELLKIWNSLQRQQLIQNDPPKSILQALQTDLSAELTPFSIEMEERETIRNGKFAQIAGKINSAKSLDQEEAQKNKAGDKEEDWEDGEEDSDHNDFNALQSIRSFLDKHWGKENSRSNDRSGKKLFFVVSIWQKWQQIPGRLRFFFWFSLVTLGLFAVSWKIWLESERLRWQKIQALANSDQPDNWLFAYQLLNRDNNEFSEERNNIIQLLRQRLDLIQRLNQATNRQTKSPLESKLDWGEIWFRQGLLLAEKRDYNRAYQVWSDLIQLGEKTQQFPSWTKLARQGVYQLKPLLKSDENNPIQKGHLADTPFIQKLIEEIQKQEQTDQGAEANSLREALFRLCPEAKGVWKIGQMPATNKKDSEQKMPEKK